MHKLLSKTRNFDRVCTRARVPERSGEKGWGRSVRERTSARERDREGGRERMSAAGAAACSASDESQNVRIVPELPCARRPR
eukprot:1960565-Pleurochrysis_carterae.AAC.1